MNRFLFGGVAGALLGVTFAMFFPCCGKKSLNKIKRTKDKVFKKLGDYICEII